MNPRLSLLQPYPFERLRQLFADITPNPDYAPISLGIGEPKHPTPPFIQQALCDATMGQPGLAGYPATLGEPALRQACTDWMQRSYGVTVDPATQVLSVNGSREALFAIAQTVIDPAGDAIVLCPNPFYQIYEGAAYLAGAEPRFLNTLADNDYAFDFTALSEAEWRRVKKKKEKSDIRKF